MQGIDFSPDGRYLATTGANWTVRVYLVSLEEPMDMARFPYQSLHSPNTPLKKW
jgi:hypothetical protein